MIDAPIAEAHIHRRAHRVLGRQLAPLSLRHLLTLEALGSPLVIGRAAGPAVHPDEDTPLHYADIILAVDICASTTEAQINAVIDPPRSLRRRWRNRRLTRRPRAWWIAQCVQWQTYWDDHMVPPQLLPTAGKKARHMQLPWQLIAVASLVHRGLSRDTAWWLPVGEALWLDLALADAAGAEYDLLTAQRRSTLRSLGHPV